VREKSTEPTSPEVWAAVDRYINELVVRPDALLDEALAASERGGLPSISVSPAQGKLLHLLARLKGARRILEIGTLAGYSTIWLARALPTEGLLITIEADPKHADVARTNIVRAGLSGVVQLRVGRALEVLPQLEAEGCGHFDLVFIDADKAGIPDYFTWSLKLTRSGSLIVVDNVVRRGSVLDAASPDPNVQGVRRFNELLAGESRISATTIQTVGSKGYDGLTLALVN
jgi:predicted O-methyltransferase YrrM